MEQATTEDPVFGKLIWDDYHHGGWGGSFADPRFAQWGRQLRSILGIDDDDEEYDDKHTQRLPMGSQELVNQFLSTAGPEMSEVLAIARRMSERIHADDGSLDTDRLRKIGRFKVVIGNPKQLPPTPAQQKAWRAFRESDAIYEQICQRLLATYREQRPQRLHWWKKMYGDSPDLVLPEVDSAADVCELLLPDEFRVYAENDGGVTVGIVLCALWGDLFDIEVRVLNGAISIVPAVDRVNGLSRGAAEMNMIESPVFGKLRKDSDGWIGRCHCEELRGYHEASEKQYEFSKSPDTRRWRSLPSWNVITGNFAVEVRDPTGDGPSPAQMEAYRQFTENLPQNARMILAAILKWYQGIRPDCVREMTKNVGAERAAAIMPEINSPEGLLDIIQLSSFIVHEQVEDDRPVAIGISFSWQDEHGVGIRWRSGKIEDIGDWETAGYDE